MDLNALIAQLKAPADGQSSETLHPQLQGSNYREPYVSSPIMSPPLASPQPQSTHRAPSGVLSPVNTPASDRAASDRTTNLLNLLKFNQPSTGLGGQASQIGRDRESARMMSASAVDLPSPSPAATSGLRNASLGVPPPTNRGTSPRPASSGTPQDLLLKLLNPGQASSAAGEKATEIPIVSSEPKAAAPEASQSFNKGQFTYINPFEQLAASSPRNKQAKSAAATGTTTPDTASKPEIAYAVPTSDTDGRTPIEALLGIGASKTAETTVAQALGEVGEQADRQAQEAIARAGGDAPVAEPSALEQEQLEMKELEEAVHEAALEIKEALKDEDKKAQLESGMPAAMAKALEDTVNSIAQENVADSWESADAEEFSAKDEAEAGVRVYNFPMKPFVGIDLVKLPAAREVRQDIVMKIASMKKEFDQVDRTLASATSNFIVYTMARGGGLRIIRQEDGTNKQVFRKAGNDMYNVEIAAPAASPLSKTSETVLATGTSGSVFWTSVSVSPNASLEDDDLDKKGFIFLPSPVTDDNTSGGQLKTRAKLSSRHPEFFAVSRGKSIHIIRPSLAAAAPYLDNKTRVVDSEKYLAERCLKIATGKSGKDFAFSGDDTIIVSLDKAGKLKFWDIREHTSPSTASATEGYRNVETKTPLMVLSTTSAADKSWATSVMFVDKERPTARGVALRYLLVGSKQNHTLQLWDLGLEKPVQELNFPHENETDAICSVCYHAKSGIIAVGHPTRNSVFFIYLSSPRYNLGSISQADYVQRLAAGDSTLPKPESTAIMTGIRELSLSSLGHLRSLQVSDPAQPSSKEPGEEETVFEVYVAHSRGIACLDIKRQDLGFDKDGKVANPVNAAAENLIEVKDLRPLQPDVADVAEAEAKPAEPEVVRKDETKDTRKETRTPPVASKPAATPSAASVTGTPKPAKAAAVAIAASEQPPKENVKEVVNKATEPLKSVKKEKLESKEIDSIATSVQGATNGAAAAPSSVAGETSPSAMNIDAAQLGETISKALGNTLSAIFGNVLGDQLESLYKRFDEDKRVQEAAGSARQDAVLRLVSSTLTDNVDKNLTRIVASTVQTSLIPAVNTVTSEAIKQQLSATVPGELKVSLQGPITKALQEPAVLKSIADHVSGKVANHVESVFSTALSQTISPAFQKLAVDAARKATSEVESRVLGQLQKVAIQHQNDGARFDQMALQHQADSAKIDQLTTLTLELLESVKGMSNALTAAQGEIGSLKLQLEQREQAAVQAAPLPSETAPKDEELELLMELMSSGRLAEGTIRWLQSARRVALFDAFFARFDPKYLKGVDPLITLSVCAAVTDALDTNLPARLKWVEVALTSFDAQDAVVVEHVGKVMDLLVQRLSDAYMGIAETEPGNPVLGRVRGLVRLAKEVKAAAA